MSTIAAISTAPVAGGIGIIRISGEESFKILEKIFKPKNEDKKREGYKIKYGYIYEGKKVVDEVLVSFFISPTSYTTEDMCEINSHGGIVVMKKILDLCLKNGAELAKPGEFTQRAFLNGRIDLSQAEAIVDIINAKTTKEAEASINQLEGFLSEEIKKIKKKILEILVYIEADIDYPEYEIEQVSYNNAMKTLEDIEKDLEKLRKSFENGKMLKDGVKVAIVGRPNVGKSSLLNEFAKEEKAIVTEFEGTTRDAIEEQIVIEGIPFKITDTAGIRETENEVEKIGITKAKKIAKESDFVIAILDSSKPLNNEDKELLKETKDKKGIIVINKIDIKDNKLEKEKEVIETGKAVIKVSLLEKKGIEEIYKVLIKMFNINEINLENTAVITNTRHKTLIEKALKNTKEAKKDIEEKMPLDIISINIKNILENLSEITGENVSEEIIKGVFSKFCLGK